MAVRLTTQTVFAAAFRRISRFLSCGSGCWLLIFSLALQAASASSLQSWTFDADPVDSAPPSFRIGTLFDGRPAGDWSVISTEKARSPANVLAQLQNKGAEHAYKVVTIEGTDSSHLELSAWFLAIEGKADMGGGVIWRATDDRNYYLTRANPLEQNIRIYRVVNGVRHMLKNFDHTIHVDKWHELRVATEGCRIQVFFDGKLVFDLCDHRFKQGKIGLWTKSDAVTYFDDLQLQMFR